MAVRGRHRRYQPNRINRASLTVTAGGAGMAIPLIGAGVAHAADANTWNKVAACESSGNWSINTGNGYYGGLQFTPVHLGGVRRHGLRRARRPGHQGPADRRRREGARRAGARRLAGLLGPRRPHPRAATTPARPAQPQAPSGQQDGPQRTRSTGTSSPQVTPQSTAGTAQMYTVVSAATRSPASPTPATCPGRLAEVVRGEPPTVGSDPDLILPGQRLALRRGDAARHAAPQQRERPGRGSPPRSTRRPTGRATRNGTPPREEDRYRQAATAAADREACRVPRRSSPPSRRASAPRTARRVPPGRRATTRASTSPCPPAPPSRPSPRATSSARAGAARSATRS